MAEFTIMVYGKDNDIVLTRREKRDIITPGLPPTSTSSMFMKCDEIEQLIEVLKEHANKRGNKEV